LLAFTADWLNIIIRWTHLIVGIGWIGASFYFIALDNAMKRRETMNEGVAGTTWEVHGGGFYHTEKYLVAPKALPDDLIWYKWEAYLTFLSGFALLCVQYYWNANAYLIDPTVLDLPPWAAVSIAVVSLAAGWFLYDGICRSKVGDNPVVLVWVVFVLILAFAVFFTNVFSGRGAFIHVGAFVGTIMAANVFAVIIPNQKKIVASLLKGEAPDAKYGKIGKQRSVHNTYLTLPVILMMVSNHYPLLTQHKHGWAVVGLVLITGAAARHFMVRHEAGDHMRAIGWVAGLAAAGLAGLILLTAPMPRATVPGLDVSDDDVLTITRTHCVMCHARKPTHEAFEQPPKGVVLETVRQIRQYAPLVEQMAVKSDTMPLGNQTNMTEEERAKLGAWIAAQ
jgi:uncharacterized membrane protein